MSHWLAALGFDLGDTIMVEASEEKDQAGTTLRAELIPGMADALRHFKSHGYRLALIADARPNTPANVLRLHCVYELFDSIVISENIGFEKPHPRIFQAALEALAISPQDYSRVAMIGNNLERDIVGANMLGLISIFYHWNERRRTQPITAEEMPRYTVTSPNELVALVARLDYCLARAHPPLRRSR